MKIRSTGLSTKIVQAFEGIHVGISIAEWIEKTGQLWEQMNKDGKIYAQGKGMKFVPLSKEEDANWAKRTKYIIDEYIKTMKLKNLPGEEAVKFCTDYVKENQKKGIYSLCGVFKRTGLPPC
jgi:hypothetical protein